MRQMERPSMGERQRERKGKDKGKGKGKAGTSSIAPIRFWVDLLISPSAGGIPLPGVKKAVLGPGCPFTSTV